ncbi:aminotransferase class V-fold PLP-dependent enzyme [Pseudalkalibacillus caeni]|uniref:Aminotransferase class V-fold PLP-dependent enzyme n=1 Tax=Exobacillus caeni TaxID=2574798 RepID=A0A5R9F4F6_9BACL|nr:aminotransferase class V-fold PLP-dependent enzyme [Pseudalkalibacillus caeni]TLS37911.1 aminotransferase class V-fold PLP-dependent enzyme [Pseudalkalibacillus caeni]
MKAGSLTFKIADQDWEFNEIYKLNYKTFVEEIPQHEHNEENMLVDRFDKENTYIVCLSGKNLVGMIAVRGKRPFSLDQKLDHLDGYLPKNGIPCEVRLLAIKKEYRKTRVFFGLISQLVTYCVKKGYDLALISGTTRESKLYKHLGFQPFGHLVGSEEAQFQPMYITREKLENGTKAFRRALDKNSTLYSLLPGPVNFNEPTRAALNDVPISHRSNDFHRIFNRTKEKLCDLVSAQHVEILLGTGTLGNDVVAGQISLLDQKGLILSNGEFGERLIDHARRFGLRFVALQKEWGEAFRYDEITHVLQQDKEIKWIWAVHCETSTGLVNEIGLLEWIASTYQLKLCLDCCSSVGGIQVDLSNVYLATTVSGKALGSYPGLGMVFYNHAISPSHKLPRYIDLGYYAEKGGVPFTHSSNLIKALDIAINDLDINETYETAKRLRKKLLQYGFKIAGDQSAQSPTVITVMLPEELDSVSVGDAMKRQGYLLSYESDYLVRKNWIQISIMGKYETQRLFEAIRQLKKVCEMIKKGKNTVDTY